MIRQDRLAILAAIYERRTLDIARQTGYSPALVSLLLNCRRVGRPEQISRIEYAIVYNASGAPVGDDKKVGVCRKADPRTKEGKEDGPTTPESPPA